VTDAISRPVYKRPEFDHTDRVLHEDRHFVPSEAEVSNANLTAYMRSKGFDDYEAFHAWSVANAEEYWSDMAHDLHWFTPWQSVFEWTERPAFKWFSGATCNIAYNCLDRHKGTPTWEKVAYHWLNEAGDQYKAITYADLYAEVNRCAAALKQLGIQRGDRVTIYLPRIPEIVVAMLAVARIGAVHSVVFAGFAASALVDRIDDAECKMVITCDSYTYKGKEVRLKAIVDEAVARTPSIEKVLVVKRNDSEVSMQTGRDVWWHETVGAQPAGVEAPVEQMDSEDPLYILYTSGSTGKPKGVLHVHGGYAVGCHATTRFVFDIKPDDVYWCSADPGWVTGHSYIIYGPLMTGATSVLFEGAMDYPDPGQWWKLIEQYKVTIFYTAPTAIRALMKYGESFPAKYDLSSLRLLGSVGEPINPEAWLWYRKVTGNRLPIMDTWWQTETGAIMISPTILTPLKPGSATTPLPGIDADVVNVNGDRVGKGAGGFLIIRKPWPSMMRTIYKATERYQSYWTVIPNVYFAGDAAYCDEDGYYWMQGRVDDVIKVSGHRLGSSEIESSLVSHPAVAESAAIGLPDDLTGEKVRVLVILKRGHTASDELAAELKLHVRKEVGPIAVPKEIEFVEGLPKTRSGKIMRRVIRARALGEPEGDLSTLES